MYEAFFGLRDKPFNITPDPRYLYLSDSHEEALSALLYGVREKKGLVTLTGPVGVGKTTILFSFFDRIDRDEEIAFFPGGVTGSRVDFFRELCKQFGLPADSSSLFDLTRALKSFTARKLEEGRNVIVLVDEAQDLGVEELNHFRYLNNLETPDAKFLQIVLAGMPELDEKLRDERLLSLRQRIAIRCVIHPLDPSSSIEYILHRLRVAGHLSDDLFTDGALFRIVNHARGIPRRINVVCDNAMIISFALKKVPVEEAFVKEALEGIEGGAWEAEGGEIVAREAIGDLRRKAHLRLQEKADPGTAAVQVPEPGPVGKEAERRPGEPWAAEPRDTDRITEFPRKVSIRGLEGGGRDGKTRKRRITIAILVLAGFTLFGLLLLVPARKKTQEETVKVPDAGTPLSVTETPAEGAFGEAVPEREPPAPSAEAVKVPALESSAPETEMPAEARPVPDAPVSSGELFTGDAGRKEEPAVAARFEDRGVAAISLARYGTLTLATLRDLRNRNPRIRDWNRLGSPVELRTAETGDPTGGPVDFYSVQVASFRQRGNTLKVAARLCGQGVENVFIVRADPTSETGDLWSSCCVGVFAGEQDAGPWRERMRESGFHDAFVVRVRGVELEQIHYVCPKKDG